jgi:para-aminobenzoate synthetase / 4-amino-4-deoxychorismate lyase
MKARILLESGMPHDHERSGESQRDAAAGAFRRRLSVTARPVEVLRALRGRPGLVALVGAWCAGSALVACDPVEVLAPGADPFEAVATTMDGSSVEHSSVFGGGWIGLWGYQLGRRLERLPEPPHRPAPQADFWLARYAWVLRQDACATWWFESLLPGVEAAPICDRLEGVLSRRDRTDASRQYGFGGFTMIPDPAAHVKVVARTLDLIAAGDIFQANLCARLEATFDGDPLDVFCRGVEATAPPYAAFVDTGERIVVSLSPELFLRRHGRSVMTAPIKGTAPVTEDPHALAASAKNRAENVMIVDLMRNDLSRVCEPGSVTVSSLARAEARAGVRHLVSEVTGRIRAGVSDAALLRATFPPGSVTGAPKVRAMEVINELESTGRELYTGAIGYVSPLAGLETSVVIRTLEFAGDRVWMGVGGGVVADSDPEAELAECYTKAAPVLAALGGRLADSTSLGDVTQAAPPATRSGAAPPLPIDRTAGERPDPTRGVFTTVLVRHSTPVLAAAHVDRLSASAEAVLGHRPDQALLLRELLKQASATQHEDSRIRLTVARDGSLETEIRAVGADTGSWRLVPTLVPGGLGAHKWVDRGVLARLQPEPDDGHTDLLLIDADGALLETGRANLFLVLDDGVHTPRADGRILPGVARAAVLELLRRRQVPVYEHDLDTADLAGAEEVFVTNAVRGVVAITECAGVAGPWSSRPAGPTTSWLRSTLRAQWLGENDTDRAVTTAVTPAETRVLLVDNYDSFVYNLADYADQLGATVTVVRNDAHSAAELADAFERGDFTHLVISPGPGRPEAAGVSTQLVRRLDGRAPVLGVCLGHQCIATAYGARVVPAHHPVHGKPALVHHTGRGVFTGIESPCVAARYHSLVVEDLPHDLEATAWTADGTLMGLRHRRHPVEGIQVHPESILTPLGHTMLGNFLVRRPGRR